MTEKGRVLITGGAVRLGRCIAEGLAQSGWQCVIHYNSSEEQARSLQSELTSKGGQCDLIQANFRERDEVSELVSEVNDQYGALDALINNASIFPSGTFLETDDRTLDQTINVNLKAPFVLTQDFVRQYEGADGQVINILDWRAEHPETDHCAYTVSKGALATLTEICAQDLAPEIRVNAILPGAVLPPEGTSETFREQMKEEVPLKRWGTPDDIAESVKFLLEGPSYISGEFLYVDGGRRFR